MLGQVVMQKKIKNKLILDGCYQCGLSLIELMIAMSLSLLLMLSIYKVFDIHEQGQTLLMAMADREDNARIAIEIIADGIRMADHWGGVKHDKIMHLPVQGLTFPGQCNADWIFNTEQGVLGFDGALTSQQITYLPSKCIQNSEYVSRSDILVLRYADSRELFYSTEIDNKRYKKHFFLRSQSGKGAVVFQGSQSSQALLMIPDEGLHYNMLFHSSMYFLKPCTKTNDTCSQGESVLTRLRLIGNRYVQEPLVEGVEQMQFEYGVDKDRDALVDHYLPARSVVEWSSVISVRMYLLVRSRVKDLSIDDYGKTYVMNSAEQENSDSYHVPSEARSFPRRLYVRELAIRNRLMTY